MVNEETACLKTITGLCWYTVKEWIPPCKIGECDFANHDNAKGHRQNGSDDSVARKR